MNGFSNDWFGSGGFRTMGATREDGLFDTREGGVGPTKEDSFQRYHAMRGEGRVESFTPWSHGIGESTPTPTLPAPRLQLPQFGPAHSFALMGQRPGFLGEVRVVQPRRR